MRAGSTKRGSHVTLTDLVEAGHMTGTLHEFLYQRGVSI